MGEAKGILSPLRTFFVQLSGGYRPTYELQVDEYENFYARLTLGETDKEPVEKIKVTSYVSRTVPAQLYDHSWQNYSLKNIFRVLGSPTDVWVGTGYPRGDHNEEPIENTPYQYELYAIYRDRAVMMRYMGSALQGPPSQACLSFDRVFSIDLLIERPSNHALENQPGEPVVVVRPIEEATGLSLEAFYEAASNSGDSWCIEVRPLSP